MTYTWVSHKAQGGFQWMVVDLWVLSHIISKLLWHDIKNKDFVSKSWKWVVVVVHVMCVWLVSSINLEPYSFFLHGLSHRQLSPGWMDEHYCYISHPDWGLLNKWSVFVTIPHMTFFYRGYCGDGHPYVGRIKQKISLRNYPTFITTYLHIVVSRPNEWMNVHVALNDWTCGSLLLVFLGVCSRPESFHPTHHDPKKQLIVHPKIQLKHCFSCLSLETFD